MSLSTEIRRALEEVRGETLGLFAHIDDADFRRQVHLDFSPLGWHLGHIGVTEGYWILQRCKGEPSLSAFYDSFFTPTENPKPRRVNLPPREKILSYLDIVRERVLAFLEKTDFNSAHPLLREANIFKMLLQHEEQHTETILLILQMMVAEQYDSSGKVSLSSSFAGEDQGGGKRVRITDVQSGMVSVPSGPFLMGSNNAADTLDNERPQHAVYVRDFLIDQMLISNREFLHFVEAGGYHNRSWWSLEGWQWREKNDIQHPLYWRRRERGEWWEVSLRHVGPLDPAPPIMCVNWYEADAYAQFAGKRLPTEAEWEKAAVNGCLEQNSSVWEWTSTWFHPYPGFGAHPYEGYSVPYFDQQHRVLRGGSWATRRHVLRPTFRNWYHPWVREIFAGFRCVQDP